jgi:hypothetical protein
MVGFRSDYSSKVKLGTYRKTLRDGLEATEFHIERDAASSPN